MRRILNKLLKLFNYTFTKLQHWYYTPRMHISILNLSPLFHRLKCHTSPTPNPRVGGARCMTFQTIYFTVILFNFRSKVKSL